MSALGLARRTVVRATAFTASFAPTFTAGAAAFAGFRKMAREGMLGRKERIAVVVTGNGLKDIESARKAVGAPILVGPSIGEFSKNLERSGFPC